MQASVGVVGTLAGAVLLGFLFYALFLAARRLRNCWLVAGYAFLGATLCFGWFSYFYSLLTSFEVLAICLIFAALAYTSDPLRRGSRPALRRGGLLPAAAAALLAVVLVLAGVAAYPALQRNAAGLLLLHGAGIEEEDTAAAGPALRAAAALGAGEPSAALAALAPQQISTPLERGIYATALAANGDWKTAAESLADEQPLPRSLLVDLLGPHMSELSPQELAFWQARIDGSDPILLLDLAIQLLVAGNYDAAEQWARSLPGYEQSSIARRPRPGKPRLVPGGPFLGPGADRPLRRGSRRRCGGAGRRRQPRAGCPHCGGQPRTCRALSLTKAQSSRFGVPLAHEDPVRPQ
jgi:hypothetical protein